VALYYNFDYIDVQWWKRIPKEMLCYMSVLWVVIMSMCGAG
jgi:hypothetical protein